MSSLTVSTKKTLKRFQDGHVIWDEHTQPLPFWPVWSCMLGKSAHGSWIKKLEVLRDSNGQMCLITVSVKKTLQRFQGGHVIWDGHTPNLPFLARFGHFWPWLGSVGQVSTWFLNCDSPSHMCSLTVTVKKTLNRFQEVQVIWDGHTLPIPFLAIFGHFGLWLGSVGQVSTWFLNSKTWSDKWFLRPDEFYNSFCKDITE